MVNGGVMFVTTPRARCWRSTPQPAICCGATPGCCPKVVQFHPTNRGVALYGDRVYVATVDAFVVALDARDGSVIWERAVGDHRQGYYVTMAPLAARGKVMVGVSGGEFGIRGYIQALDARTGEPAWKTYTIPRRPRHDRGPATRGGRVGAPAWVTATFDPALNLTYWGTGNPGPWMGDARPGDNLYANSVIALDADTGARSPACASLRWDDSRELRTKCQRRFSWTSREAGAPPGARSKPGERYLWLLERSASDLVRGREAVCRAERLHATRARTPRGRLIDVLDRQAAISRPGVRRQGLAQASRLACPATRAPANENLCRCLEWAELVNTAGSALHGRGVVSSGDSRGRDHLGELQGGI